MRSFNTFFGKLFQICDYIFRLAILNVLIIIPSFLLLFLSNYLFKNIHPILLNIIIFTPVILYFYPGICAVVDVIRKYEMKESDGVFVEYFSSLKRNYIKALIESIIINICILLMYNSLSFFYNHFSDNLLYTVGFFLSISFSIILLMIIINLSMVMNYMRGCMFFHDIKLSFIMTFDNIGCNLLLVLICGLIAFLSIKFSIIFALGGVSIPLYLITKLNFKKYYLVYIKTSKAKQTTL